MNDKIKHYMNDEGEFLIPFEQIQRGKLPRRHLTHQLGAVYIIAILCGASLIGGVCGLAFALLLVR